MLVLLALCRFTGMSKVPIPALFERLIWSQWQVQFWRESQNDQEKDKSDVPGQMATAARAVQWLGMLQPQV